MDAEALPASGPPSEHCLNCGESITRRYCASCGQRTGIGRLRTREVVSHAIGQFFDLEAPPWRTIRDLTLRPGRVADEYVSGRRMRYTSPVKYALILTALYVLVLETFNVDLGNAVNLKVEGGTPEQTARLSAILSDGVGWVRRHINLLLLLAVPAYAGALRLLFRRAGRNFAECCALALYVQGHGVLASLLLSPLGVVGTFGGNAALQLAKLSFATWASVVFFQSKSPTGVLRAVVAAMLLMLALFVVASAGVLIFVLPGHPATDAG
ncbi:MAG: DUF3667 domain-containing protein [Phycisphaeraceae bacterium]|nr:DUF3667 domain-containing protein [Phycisphaeraceae bacterium]